MEYRYHLIKEDNINLDILEENKCILMCKNGFADFTGTTHEEYKEHGQQNHINLGLSSTFGKMETKEGASYWVLPYPYDINLDVERKEGEEIISQTLTLSELENFGFDEPDITI